MKKVSRRKFLGIAVALAARGPQASPTNRLDAVLRSGIESRKIPAVTAMTATADQITYTGAFGTRDEASRLAVTPESIFAIRSMTKAITTVASLQLVEQRKLKLDDPVARHISEFGGLQVLDGYDKDGKPSFHRVRTPVTLRHLLTHTSGFCYDTWTGEMDEYIKRGGLPPVGVAPFVPLMFEPGTRWHYGYSLDWAGRLVEVVSGLSLEEYFRTNILQPLGMNDTSFIVPPEKFDRLVSNYQRQEDGTLKQEPRVLPGPPTAFNGGGGLFSTCGDYVKFMQMILRRGRASGKEQILTPQTIELMSSNQIGRLSAGKLKSYQPSRSSDVDLHPGADDKWGFGFLINTTAYSSGRSAGSLAWAGLQNTYYWIDPHRGLCATIMMQYLPFVDHQAVALVGDFEHAMYAS